MSYSKEQISAAENPPYIMLLLFSSNPAGWPVAVQNEKLAKVFIHD
jgi:hypothetical protein